MSTDVSDKEHLAQVGSPGNWLLEVEHGSRAVGRPILIGAVIRTESSAYLLVRMSTERRVRVTDDYIVEVEAINKGRNTLLALRLLSSRRPRQRTESQA
jgi:hypothetical protein